MKQSRYSIEEACQLLKCKRTQLEELIFNGKIVVQAYWADVTDDYADLQPECVRPLISKSSHEESPVFVVTKKQAKVLKHSTVELEQKITLEQLKIHFEQLELARELLTGSFEFNSDFTQVRYHKHHWSFDPRIGAVIKYIYEKQIGGATEVQGSDALRAIGHKTEQSFAQIFRIDSKNEKHPCFGTLIKEGSKRGWYYLNIEIPEVS